jgi:hypothetical protein
LRQDDISVLTFRMSRQSIADLVRYDRAALKALSRQELEQVTWQYQELARSLFRRLDKSGAAAPPPPLAEVADQASNVCNSGGPDQGSALREEKSGLTADSSQRSGG